MTNIIETEELTKYYGFLFWKRKEPALSRLTIQIPEGSVFGFLGPNGAGKTTTIKLVMDLIRPTEGSVKVFGKSPNDMDVKRMLGFLPDCPAFSSYLSAYDFLNICAKLLRIPSSERKKKIMEVLRIVKMERHAKSKVGGFSRGMIQRIGIAQAILNDPKLLVLDEPLVGLDPHGRQDLKDIIVSQRDKGTTVFFSSHILSDVEKICDRIGILNRGVLLCSGRIDELLSVTGVRAHINAGYDDIAKDLMGYASGTIKLPSGGWDLVFQNNTEAESLINSALEKSPGSIVTAPTRESLEEFFFRKVENSSGMQ